MRSLQKAASACLLQPICPKCNRRTFMYDSRVIWSVLPAFSVFELLLLFCLNLLYACIICVECCIMDLCVYSNVLYYCCCSNLQVYAVPVGNITVPSNPPRTEIKTTLMCKIINIARKIKCIKSREMSILYTNYISVLSSPSCSMCTRTQTQTLQKQAILRCQ